MPRETFSINWLAVNLQVDRRTLNKRLEGVAQHGEAREYYLVDVFRALVVTPPRVNELEQARTRLAREQADRLAYENAVSAGELGNVVELASVYAGAVSNAVTKLNAIPDAVAQRFDANTAPRVRTAIREVLDSAIADLRADSERAARGTRGSVAHAAGPNGESVGGRASKALERGKRRARSMAN